MTDRWIPAFAGMTKEAYQTAFCMLMRTLQLYAASINNVASSTLWRTCSGLKPTIPFSAKLKRYRANLSRAKGS